MSENRNSKGIIYNFIWRFLERIGAQGVTFVVSIILARILEPEVYGTVAIVTVFTSLMQVFVDSGLGNALIQKKEADDLDFSSVFFFNIVFCIILYIIVYIAAPLIASFYNKEELTSLVRVLGITILISGIKNIQQAYVSRNMLFKRFFFSTLGGTIFAAIIGIFLAYKGYGAWALVCQNIANQAIDTIILWLTVKWRPKWMFSISRLRAMFAYGWKLLAASIVDVVYTDLRQLMIGKIYTTNDLAYYNKGVQLPKFIVNNLNSSIITILFSVMSKEQEDLKKIKGIVKRSIELNAYILFPIMTGMGVCAPSIIKILLTDKWISCVPYLQIFCFEYSMVMFNTSNQNAYRSIGRSDIYLRNEILCKIVGLVSILSTIWISVYALALSSAIATIICSVINAWSNKKILKYGFFEQLKDMMPNLVLTIIMGIIVWSISLLGFNEIIEILLQIVVGATIYILGSKLLQLEAYKYLILYGKTYIHKNANKIDA